MDKTCVFSLPKGRLWARKNPYQRLISDWTQFPLQQRGSLSSLENIIGWNKHRLNSTLLNKMLSSKM